MEEIPCTQTAAVLHALKSPYVVDAEAAVPALQHDAEVLVRSQVIGLNPIDWKAPDFGFGIPALPYIAGREVAGRVVRTARKKSRLQPGDQVIVISTDYRDVRKAAYQEYVVAQDFNAVKLPRGLSPRAGATLGVGFVAAALALGVCMGVDFGGEAAASGPDLRAVVCRAAAAGRLPADSVGKEAAAAAALGAHERARAGDWLVLGGGSSTSAGLALQLARLAGLRVAVVVDAAKHAARLAGPAARRPDLLVDAHDPERAVAVLRRGLGGRLRFALDTRGRDSAAALARALRSGPDDADNDAAASPRLTPPSSPTPNEDHVSRAHLVGLAGLPREPETPDLVYHSVPIKLYHEVPEVGEALSLWLERLLERGLLVAPDIVAVEEGFGGINKGLDRMRSGEVSGGKAIVVLDDPPSQTGDEGLYLP